MKRILYSFLLPFFLLTSVTAFAQQDLPRGLSLSEIPLIHQYSPPLAEGPTPPPSPLHVRTMAEWEELQALLIAWNAGSNGRRDILTEIVRAAREECRVIICCRDQFAITAARNYLISKGVNVDTNVEFIIADNNTIWIRDYGPNCVYFNDVESLYFIDWIYNRPRPLDDTLSRVVANYVNVPLYSTLFAPNDLVHTGGNFMSDGFGTGFSSKLVLDENGSNNNYGQSNHSEAEVDEIMFDYMGIHRYPKMTNLPYDDIHHIDMHMKLLDEETLLVGAYPPGISDGPQIEANIQYVLSNYLSVFGTPYKLVRIPMPPVGTLYPSNGGDYRTYANAVFVNKTVIVPFYELRYDTTARRIWEEALPGYKIVGVNCNNIIPSGGAIHCITKEIGVNDPLRIVHQRREDVVQNAQYPANYPVFSLIQHKSGIAEAKVWYTTDTSAAWQWVEMTPYNPADTSDIWVGYIPRQESGTELFYYIEASANTGKKITRPLPAPQGWWKFRINFDVSATSNPTPPAMMPAFPNPAGAITCIPVQAPRGTLARLSLLNALGQTMEIIFEGLMPGGSTHYFFHANRYPAGVYYIKLESEAGQATQKILLR
jgi:agmatine deiminase